MTQQKQPPNVLVIMSDQHHKRYMSCAGDPIVRTPALDALAARGTRFENAYCASPLCGPSRSAFMTGQMPSTNGVLCNHRQLDSDTLTFAHMFGASGYETVLSGRMHFNGPDQRHGFHKRLVSDCTHLVFKHTQEMMNELLGDNGPWFTGPHVEAIRKSGPGRCSYEQYDQHVAQVTADWLTQRKQDERPFMLTVGFVLPHAPFVCSDEDFDYYDKLVSEDDLPPWDEHDALHPYNQAFSERSKLTDQPRVSKKDQRRARVAYYGMCASVDRQVSRILDALEASGQLENTIVVYTSDHGEQLGEHGLWWKHTFYEGSAGVPLIFAGPGVPKGKTIAQNVSLIDLGQTLLDMTGSMPNPTSEGQSFKCLFEGKPDAWHDTAMCENLWLSSERCIARMLKQGPWKLNHYHGHWPELFNLETDPGEIDNLANDESHAAIRDQMMARLLKGWDHDAVLAKQLRYEQGAALIREARWQSDMPEPDKAWCKNLKVENYVDTSR